MILQLNDDSMVIISEDTTEATYLKHLFGGRVVAEVDISSVKVGFHKTEEIEARFTVSRVEEEPCS